MHFLAAGVTNLRVAHPLDFGSSKGADFDFPNIQQTKVFPN